MFEIIGMGVVWVICTLTLAVGAAITFPDELDGLGAFVLTVVLSAILAISIIVNGLL